MHLGPFDPTTPGAGRRNVLLLAAAAIVFVTIAVTARGATPAPALGALEEVVKVEHGEASLYTVASNGGNVVACDGYHLRDTDLVFAHPTMPCGAKARITYNGRSVVATCIDRGPFVRGRIIDLNLASANQIGLPGIGPVKVEWLKLTGM